MKKYQSIPELIASLEKQILETGQEIKKAENLERLREVAKSYSGEDEIITSEAIQARLKATPDEMRYMSRFKGLDDILGGFRPQQLIVISALTKSGKTTFLMEMTVNMKEYSPLWFPFEESAEELVRKYMERNMEPPYFTTPKYIPMTKIEWIEKKIIESIAKYNTKIVFIDHLDFIIPYSSDNRADRIGDAMRALKALAKKWEVTIFLICHLVKTKMDEQPTLEDLKGSSSIGQEADTVILLWRQMKKEKGKVVITDNVNISVQANRRTGKTGNVEMIYKDGRFTEIEWSRSQDDIEADKTLDNW